MLKVNKCTGLKVPGYVSRIEDGGNAFKIVTYKPTGRRILGKCRRTWVENIRVNIN